MTLAEPSTTAPQRVAETPEGTQKPTSRVEPTQDNPCGYPPYNVNHVNSYSRKQLSYYRRHVSFTAAETKRFIEAVKNRRELLDLLGETRDSQSEEDEEEPQSILQRSREVSRVRTPLRERATNHSDSSSSANRSSQPHNYDDEESDSDCPESIPGVKYQKFGVQDTAKLKYNTDIDNFHI
jgi:hypothetical protein